MPYKVLDLSAFGFKTTLEDELNSYEREGWDFLQTINHLAIFHKPYDKPKRQYNRKDPKNGTPELKSPVAE